MTNKKKSKSTKKAAAASSNTSTTTTTPSPSSPQTTEMNKDGQLFSQGQFTAVIFVCLGVSKLFELYNAVLQVQDKYNKKDDAIENDDDDSTSTTNNNNKTSICETYLLLPTNNTDVVEEEQEEIQHPCSYPGTQIWIFLKFFASIQCFWIVITLLGLCWNEEDLLVGVLLCLAVSPLLLTMGGLLLVPLCRDTISSARSTQLLLLCFILFLIAMPIGGKNNSNFKLIQNYLHQRRLLKKREYKTHVLSSLLPTFCIATLFFLQFWNALQTSKQLYHHYYYTTTEDNGETDDTTSTNTTTNEYDWSKSMEQANYGIIMTEETKLPMESLVLMFFHIIDQISIAILLIFVQLLFEQQRQTTFLLSMALCKFMEYTYQLPYFFDNATSTEVSTNNSLSEAYQTRIISCAAFAAVAWVVPTFIRLETKKQKQS